MSGGQSGLDEDEHDGASFEAQVSAWIEEELADFDAPADGPPGSSSLVEDFASCPAQPSEPVCKPPARSAPHTGGKERRVPILLGLIVLAIVGVFAAAFWI